MYFQLETCSTVRLLYGLGNMTGDQFTLNFMVINIMKMNTWISHFILPLTNKFVNIY